RATPAKRAAPATVAAPAAASVPAAIVRVAGAVGIAPAKYGAGVSRREKLPGSRSFVFWHHEVAAGFLQNVGAFEPTRFAEGGVEYAVIAPLVLDDGGVVSFFPVNNRRHNNRFVRSPFDRHEVQTGIL